MGTAIGAAISSISWYENQGCQPKEGIIFRVEAEEEVSAISSCDVMPWLEATDDTRSWSCERVAIMVRALAFIWGILASDDIISVGWQWAS